MNWVCFDCGNFSASDRAYASPDGRMFCPKCAGGAVSVFACVQCGKVGTPSDRVYMDSFGVTWCGKNCTCVATPVLPRIHTRREAIEKATGAELDTWAKFCGNGARCDDTDDEYRARVLRNFDAGNAPEGWPSVVSYCEQSGVPKDECRCHDCTAPITQRTADAAGTAMARQGAAYADRMLADVLRGAAPREPCKLTYYGLDCTGCGEHPRGLSVDDLRKMRRAR